MSAKILFMLIFLSQVVTINGFLPRKLILSASRTLFIGRHFSARSLRAYRMVNVLVMLIGVGLYFALLRYDFFDEVTITLASIGLYFLLQLLPLTGLILLGSRAKVASKESLLDEETASQLRSLRLFQVASPVFVGTALLLLAAYVVCLFFGIDGSSDVLLKKLVVVLGTNLCFAGAILYNFSTLGKADNISIKSQHRSVVAGVNLMIFGSIMISVYWFAKEAIVLFDLDQFRPTMMSAFLHLPALILFTLLFQEERSFEDGV